MGYNPLEIHSGNIISPPTSYSRFWILRWEADSQPIWQPCLKKTANGTISLPHYEWNCLINLILLYETAKVIYSIFSARERSCSTMIPWCDHVWVAQLYGANKLSTPTCTTSHAVYRLQADGRWHHWGFFLFCSQASVRGNVMVWFKTYIMKKEEKKPISLPSS